MTRRFMLVCLLVLLAAFSGPAIAPAAGPAGLTLTINAPTTFSAGAEFTVSGYLVVYAQAPVYFETSRGLAGQSIDLLIDGAPGITVTTNSEGRYSAHVTFGPNPPTTHTLQAVAFRGTPLEARSRIVSTSIDRFLIGLTITPSPANVAAGGTIALHAIGEFDDGRTADVTEQVSWSSSNPAAATVSNAAGTRGVVTGVAPGTATIVATGSGLSASATVTVA